MASLGIIETNAQKRSIFELPPLLISCDLTHNTACSSAASAKTAFQSATVALLLLASFGPTWRMQSIGWATPLRWSHIQSSPRRTTTPVTSSCSREWHLNIATSAQSIGSNREMLRLRATRRFFGLRPWRHRTRICAVANLPLVRQFRLFAQNLRKQWVTIGCRRSKRCVPGTA